MNEQIINVFGKLVLLLILFNSLIKLECLFPILIFPHFMCGWQAFPNRVYACRKQGLHGTPQGLPHWMQVIGLMPSRPSSSISISYSHYRFEIFIVEMDLMELKHHLCFFMSYLWKDIERQLRSHFCTLSEQTTPLIVPLKN